MSWKYVDAKPELSIGKEVKKESMGVKEEKTESTTGSGDANKVDADSETVGAEIKQESEAKPTHVSERYVYVYL